MFFWTLAFITLPGLTQPAPGLPSQSAGATANAEVRRANDLLGAVPLRFEANQGQLPAGVKFVTRLSENNVQLTANEAIVSVPGGTLRMKPKGAKVNPAIRGLNLLPGKTGYLIGNDRRKWANAENFSAVRYEAVYPGIDMVYHGDGKKLEYDFIVAPGASPNRIAMEFSGARSISIDAAGDLILATGEVKLRQPKPFVYQTDAAGRRVSVEASYRKIGGNQVAFQLGDYDRSRELVIDPVLTLSSFLGGSANDVISAVAIDPLGFIWVAGYSVSYDLSATPGTFRNLPISRDAFVARIDPNQVGAQSLTYLTYVGGYLSDEATAIVALGTNNVIVVGTTSSPDFPVRNSYQATIGGGFDAFVIGIDYGADGDATLSYSSLIGGTGAEAALAVAIDSQSRVYVTGYTSSDDLVLTPNVVQNNSRGGYEIFLAVLDTTKQDAATGIYVTYLGSGGTEVATGVAVNAQGKVYLSGYAIGDDFPTAGISIQGAYGGGGDAFLVRLDITKPGLDALEYGTYFGGNDFEMFSAMALDKAGRVFLTGYSQSTDFPVKNAYQPQNGGGADAIVVVFDFSKPPADVLVYSSYLGGGSTDIGYGIAVNEFGQALVTGYTYSKNYPIRGNPAQAAFTGHYDAFLSWVTPGNIGVETLSCSTYLGGSAGTVARGVAAGKNGNVYIAGYTNSSNLPMVGSSTQNVYYGLTDGFIARYSACGPLPPASDPVPPPPDQVDPVATVEPATIN
jgi:hypothetical protein